MPALALLLFLGALFQSTRYSVSGALTGTPIGVSSIQSSASGIGNAADTTDDTLFTYSLPSNSMSANGKSLRVRATGMFAPNINSKRVKLWFGGTAIVDSGVLTLSGKNWTVEMEVARIDATHVSATGTFVGDTASIQNVGISANLSVSDLTANATEIKVTGASTITAAANDVLGYVMKVWFEN